jgi:hypothetical protein
MTDDLSGIAHHDLAPKLAQLLSFYLNKSFPLHRHEHLCMLLLLLSPILLFISYPLLFLCP